MKKYKYDIHVHTKETSRCGYIRAAEIVRKSKELGYDGICITDHLNDEFFINLMHCRDDWQACMDQFIFGYNEAKKAGDAIGLDVILGVELRFPENENDFLVYGVDEEWLRSNPYICRMTRESFFEKYGNDVLIIYAHPYRNNDDVHSGCVHGLEIVNCNLRHDSRNDMALELARANPHLLRLCGSDTHRPGDEGLAAVLLEERVRDSYELKDALKKQRFKLWCPVFEEIISESEEDT